MSSLIIVYKQSLFRCNRHGGTFWLRNTSAVNVRKMMTHNSPFLTEMEKEQKVSETSLFRGQSTEAYLQVIQSGCPGYGKCLYLFTTAKRYLINCPEGASRFLTLTTNRFSILDNIFVTRSTWANIGGLPGFAIMKRQAAGGKLPSVNFHGPKEMDLIFKSTKCVYDGEPPVNFVEKPYDLQKFEDDTLKIDYVPLFGRKKCVTDVVKNEEYEKTIDEEILPADDDLTRDVSVGYVFKFKPKPGHLNVLKCMKAGVPRGPLLGELAKGNDVTLADGKLVKSSEVMSDPEPTPCFAVVDVNDEFFLDSLLKTTQFDRFFDETEALDLLVHFTPLDIFNSESYGKWMAKFGTRTRHLILNERAPFLPHNEGAFRVQSELNYVDSDLFPLLACHKCDLTEINSKNTDLNGGSSQFIYAEPSLKYNFRPHTKFARDETIFDAKIHVEKLLTNAEFVAARAAYVEQTDRTKNRQVVQYPQVVFAGTGSACPTKTKNVSGILINLNDNHSMLFDCGEGTYSQLYELYGPDEIDRILCNIKLVFISHLHADHHMGLFTLMIKRKEAFDRLNLNFESLYIVGPLDLFKIQSMYSKFIEDILPYARRIHNTLTFDGDPVQKNSEHKLIEVKRRLNLKSIKLVRVIHPRFARGIVVRLADGKKLVYSGDTRPCPELIEAGMDADLLIHEATLDDEMVEEAMYKKHSTLSEACEVAREMRAKRTIFTHFSGRYTRLPIIIDETVVPETAGFAFDYLKVGFSRLERLPRLTNVLKLAFAEYEERNANTLETRRSRKFRENLEKTKKKTKVA